MFQDLPPPPIIEEAEGGEDIVITAAHESQRIADSSKAITMVTPTTVERLGEEDAVGILRLLPSAAIAQAGPRGTQAQLRIRGAEANHSLLFIEGIKANDPAAGNEARFELAADGLYDLIEYARGPQSAIWGSEALGGVVALRSLPAARDQRLSALIAAGSFNSLDGQARLDLGDRQSGLVLSLAGQRSDGIDSFDGNGDEDGHHNLNARLSGRIALGETAGLLLSGFAIDARSEFDGFDPLTFLRADTDDESHSRLGAGRIAIDLSPTEAINLEVGGTALASSNINGRDGSEINRTSAERYSLDGKGSVRFAAGKIEHRITIAIDHEVEHLRSDDTLYGGFTAQERDRDRVGLTAEWFATHASGASLQIAARHDAFSDFANATSISAGGILPLAGGLSLVANYGEGIAQPSFYDLHGFFPGSFVGNPALRSESSRGHDVGLRYRDGDVRLSALWFRQTLEDEIVDIFDPASFTSTTANGEGQSRRSGVELEASWRASPLFELSANYSYLDAKGSPTFEGVSLRETRRPEHRAAVIATGQAGRFDYGASFTIVGARFDDDFDRFPAERVRLEPYALASAQFSYRLNGQMRLSLRAANLFDSEYQDVIGYRTMGRTVRLGLSFAR